MSELEIGWEADRERAPELARFFVAQVDPSYISHGEMMEGRAIGPDTWVDDLEGQMTGELEEATRSGSTFRVAVARLEGRLVGLALIEWLPTSRLPHLVLDDMVVDRTARGLGIGRKLLRFVEDEARRGGIRAIFLESGTHNHGAHHFFEREGFAVSSVTLLKQLA